MSLFGQMSTPKKKKKPEKISKYYWQGEEGNPKTYKFWAFAQNSIYLFNLTLLKAVINPQNLSILQEINHHHIFAINFCQKIYT